MARYQAWSLDELKGKKADELIDWFLSDDLQERTVGLAVLNALSQRIINKHPELYRIDDTSDLFSLLNLDKSNRVDLVGYFRPMIARLLEKAG